MRVSVVIPCYNEERRLQLNALAPLLERAEIVFAENGSTDGTNAMLAAFCAQEPRARLLSLGGVGGKAEAVRRAMLDALAHGAEATGFLDADLATPPREMVRIIDRVQAGASVVIGARIVRPGARIERPFVRRHLGRIFARLASLTLGAQVRDTQCGAKLFRGSPALEAALAKPFSARWAFDVELLGRLLQQGVSIDEVELDEWRDVAGSKLRALDFPRMAFELVQIRNALRSR